jgi:transposase
MRYLGIDVAKAKLDCLLLDPSTGKQRSKSVPNSAQGIKTLLACLNNWGVALDEVHAVLEPTASYHEEATLALHEAGLRVSLLNPGQVRKYAQALGIRSKTDALDAAVLARFAAAHPPALWAPPPPAARTLKALLVRRDALAADLQRERNRQEKLLLPPHTPEAVAQSITKSLSFLQAQLDELQRQIDQHIDQDPDLRYKQDLLLSIPGVGPRVAQHMSALMSVHDFQSADQLSAYLGLVPVQRQSGSSLLGRSRLSKNGPSELRRLLYLPAVTASRHNPLIKALYERLIAHGKPKMAALGAAMRKLACLCFGVVRSGKPFDSKYLPQAA